MAEVVWYARTGSSNSGSGSSTAQPDTLIVDRIPINTLTIDWATAGTDLYKSELTDIEYDNIGGFSLDTGTDTITFPAGIYYVELTSTIYFTQPPASNSNLQVGLYDTTNGAYLADTSGFQILNENALDTISETFTIFNKAYINLASAIDVIVRARSTHQPQSPPNASTVSGEEMVATSVAIWSATDSVGSTGVQSWNGLTGTVVATTDDLPEGAINLYANTPEELAVGVYGDLSASEYISDLTTGQYYVIGLGSQFSDLPTVLPSLIGAFTYRIDLDILNDTVNDFHRQSFIIRRIGSATPNIDNKSFTRSASSITDYIGIEWANFIILDDVSTINSNSGALSITCDTLTVTPTTSAVLQSRLQVMSSDTGNPVETLVNTSASDSQEWSRFDRGADQLSMLFGTATPVGSVTPPSSGPGSVYFDTSFTPNIWVAEGATSSDWLKTFLLSPDIPQSSSSNNVTLGTTANSIGFSIIGSTALVDGTASATGPILSLSNNNHADTYKLFSLGNSTRQAIFFSRDGSPVGVITPTVGIGSYCVDTATPALWVSIGTTSNDWSPIGKNPTVTILDTVGPGTYAAPPGCTRAVPEWTGGGGGGGDYDGTAGSPGGDTIWDTGGTPITAAGGLGGAVGMNGYGAAGGTGGSGTATGIERFRGNVGGGSANRMGYGGSSPFFGGGSKGGAAAEAGEKGSGGSAGYNTLNANQTASGGGSGECVRLPYTFSASTVSSPVTFDYTIGAGGAGGTAGAVGTGGNDGGDGYIRVTEYYGAN